MENKKLSIKYWMKICLWIACGCFLILLLFSKQLFGEDSVFAKALQNDEGEFVGFIEMLEGNLPVIIKSIAIIIITYGISKVARLVLKKYFSMGKRKITIAKMLDNLIKYAAALIIVFNILTVLGFDTSTILASAGILTLVVGLGAQSLISDIISGLFIMFEGDYNVNDIVVVNGWRGTVQEIGIRTTKIIDAGGNVKIINNSSISDIVNMTNNLSLAVCDVGIEYGESIERVEKIIMNSLDTIRSRIPAISDGPFYKGVSELGDSAVILKIIANCKEEDKFQVQRDLNREIKIIFDKNNVNIPFPQVVLNKPVTFEDITERDRKVANKFVDEQREQSKQYEDEK